MSLGVGKKRVRKYGLEYGQADHAARGARHEQALGIACAEAEKAWLPL